MEIGKNILHYKILEKLGEGGMGVVYKAEDLKLKRIVALKFLPTHLMYRPRFRIRLEREAQAASSLNHPNICQVYAYHETDDYVFLVMEYIAGETLKQIIDREGPFPQDKAVEIITQVAEALAAAHQNGVIHRDIKSENIMITKNGQVKVTDFGLAKLKDAPTITKSGFPIGTVAYMSPELVLGKAVDHRTDLWSLGVVFFEMLTGELPFKGESDVGVMNSIISDKLPKLNNYLNNVDRSLEYIITTLLEKRIVFRYTNVEMLSNDLQQKIIGSRIKLSFRNIRKNKIKVMAAIFLLIILTSLSFSYLKKYNRPFWFKEDTPLIRLTAKQGTEGGYISPEGDQLVFQAENSLYIKNINTDRIKKLWKSPDGIFPGSTWSPDGKQIAFISDAWTSISMFDVFDDSIDVLLREPTGQIYFINWAPNGKWIAYNIEIQTNDKISTQLKLLDLNTLESKTLLKYELPEGVTKTAWYPDSKKIAFSKATFGIEKSIHIFDINEGTISPPLVEQKYLSTHWARGGLVYSPNGKYLIYPDSVNKQIELLALPVKNGIFPSKRPAIPITKLSGIGVPFWPCFDKKGKLLSFGISQTYKNINIASIDLKNMKILTNFIRIDTIEGDISFVACWSPDCQKIAFISNKNGQDNIFLWHRESRSISQLTETDHPKRNVSFLPDKRAISYLSNGNLWLFNLDDSLSQQIFPRKNVEDNIHVISYTWARNSDTLYALSTRTKKDWLSSGKILQISLNNQKINVLKENILLDHSSHVSYQSQLNMIAFQCPNLNSNQRSIKVIVPSSKNTKLLVRYKPFFPANEISWLPKGQYLLFGSDVNGYLSNKLVSLKDNTIKIVKSPNEKSNIFLGSLSPKGDEVIFYTFSEESDIWMLDGR